MNFGYLALAFAGAGAVGAAVLDSHYPDKSLTIPDWVPGLGGKVVEPGVALGLAGLAAGALTGVPVVMALGAGAGLYEGGKIGAEYAMPGPPALPPGTPAVAGMGGFNPPPRFAVGAYGSISDRSVMAALNEMDALGGGRHIQ